MQAQFAFLSSRGRQGERGGSEHTSASIVAESSGIAELVVGADYRRDRCPAPDTREKHRSELCCQKGCALLCSGKICGRFQCADNVWIYHGTPRMWMNVSGPGSQAVLGLPCGRQEAERTVYFAKIIKALRLRDKEVLGTVIRSAHPQSSLRLRGDFCPPLGHGPLRWRRRAEPPFMVEKGLPALTHLPRGEFCRECVAFLFWAAR